MYLGLHAAGHRLGILTVFNRTAFNGGLSYPLLQSPLRTASIRGSIPKHRFQGRSRDEIRKNTRQRSGRWSQERRVKRRTSEPLEVVYENLPQDHPAQQDIFSRLYILIFRSIILRTLTRIQKGAPFLLNRTRVNHKLPSGNHLCPQAAERWWCEDMHPCSRRL